MNVIMVRNLIDQYHLLFNTFYDEEMVNYTEVSDMITYNVSIKKYKIILVANIRRAINYLTQD
jgi:hypothetical protein